MRKPILTLAVAIPLVCLLALLVYNIPPVHDRLAWRLEEVAIQVRSVLSPPERVAFDPQGQVAPVVQITRLPPTAALTPSASPTPEPTLPESTPLPSPTATLMPTPLPPSLNLTGVRYIDQHGLENYCAPSNLAMALSYWGWEGDRLDTGKVLKPYTKDKNVMPYEMADYVREHTGLKVVVRVGGDPDMIKRLLVNEFPVLVEKGAYIRDMGGVVSWMGHYEVVTGYDEAREVFITQDSYYKADYEVPYDEFISGWHSFNDTYLVIYPAEKEQQVMDLLGAQADEAANYRYAAEKASQAIYSAANDVEKFFAWFNRGTNLKELQDFGGAAEAYDEAFAIYNTLPEDKSIRPYRILWYQTGPYFAYFYTGRYYDVISLANATLDSSVSTPALEESFYWRAMAKLALGDSAGAADDFRESLKYHPDFPPTVQQLNAMGVEP